MDWSLFQDAVYILHKKENKLYIIKLNMLLYPNILKHYFTTWKTSFIEYGEKMARDKCQVKSSSSVICDNKKIIVSVV
jgi:hypothetical protein